MGSCHRIELNSLTGSHSEATVCIRMTDTRTKPVSGLGDAPRLVRNDAPRVVQTDTLRVVETDEESTIQDHLVDDSCASQGPELVMFSDADPLGARPVVIPDPWADLKFQANLVMALPDAAVATDADYNIRLANPAAEALYDFVAADVVGTSVINLFQLDEDPAKDAEIKRANEQVLHEKGFWSGRVRHRTAAGEVLDVDATVTLLRDETSTMRGALFLSRDVTPLRRAERAAAERTEFADAVLESLPGRTCVIDSEGTVVAVNRRYRDEGPAGAGEGTGPALGDDYIGWLDESVENDAAKDLRELLTGDCPDFRTEFATVRRRKRYWTELFAVPLSTGEAGAVVTHVDITTRKQAESALTRRATHDALTGLPNRVLLADRLAHALSRAARTKTQVGLLFCDLDGFRNVNNTYGHLAGDRLLVTIAKRLRAVCRSSDTVARVSGDEFVIILEDVEGRGEVEEVARRIIEALTEPVVLEQGNAKTGTSIGLVISSGVPRAGIRTVENLIRDADSAMYAAKEAGRARYAWFSPEMRERPRERATFVQAINRLLNR